jgi:hypothetical protein
MHVVSAIRIMRCIRLDVCRQRVGSIALVYLLVVLACLPACARTTDPKPGDKDYPVENPHPTHFIQFTTRMPATLAVDFRVTYLADAAAGGPPDSETACVRTAGLAVTAPFGVSMPLRLSRDGNTYHGSIAVDHFLPGRCNWNVAFVDYREAHTSVGFDRLAQFGDAYPSQADFHLHLWCIKDPHAAAATPPELCGIPNEFTNYIRSDYIERIPADERQSFRADAKRSAQSITLTFHDFNALPDAQSFLK